MTNDSKYNFPNVQKVQILEQIDIYIENSYPNDPEVKSAIADRQILLTQLQSQQTHRLAALRQQLLNPERHWQAIKATSGEVAKHYLEESVWAKAILTYFDKLSESPNYGA